MKNKSYDGIILAYKNYLKQTPTKLTLKDFNNAPKYVQHGIKVYVDSILINMKLFNKMHQTIKFNKLDKDTKKLVLFFKNLNKQVLAKFNTPKHFALTVAINNVTGLLIATPGDKKAFMSSIKLIESNYAKQANELKKLETMMSKSNIGKLTEADILFEADIKSMISKTTTVLANAFKSSMSALIEGWLFVLKGLGVVSTKIQAQLKKLEKVAGKQLGRGIYSLFSKFQPDVISFMDEQNGGKQGTIEYFSQFTDLFISMGKYVATFVLGGAQVGAIVGAIKVINTALNVTKTAGEVAQVGEVIQSITSITDDSDFQEMLDEL